MFLKASYKYWDENAVRKWYYKENQSNNITTYKIVRDFRPVKISVGMSSILFPSNILKKDFIDNYVIHKGMFMTD